jgi:hypothetical protein
MVSGTLLSSSGTPYTSLSSSVTLTGNPTFLRSYFSAFLFDLSLQIPGIVFNTIAVIITAIALLIKDPTALAKAIGLVQVI